MSEKEVAMDQGVEIILGRPRRLKFRYQDMRALEEKVGKPLGEIVADLGRLSIRTTEMVLWAGLRHEDARLAPGDMLELLGEYFEGGKSLSDLMEVLRKAVQESGFFAATTDGLGAKE